MRRKKDINKRSSFFPVIDTAFRYIYPICNIAILKRGRFTIYILLKITFSRAFHLAFKTI